MKATDIERLHGVSSPSLSPDGSHVVFAVTRPDLGADAYVGQLWTVRVAGTAPAQRLTRGFRDAAPRHSPDGSSVAFLRSIPGARPQVVLMPAGGGEPLTLTDATLGVDEFRWSPDGTRIAYLARVPEQGRYGIVDGRDAAAESPRRITTVTYKRNGIGYTGDRPAQVFVVDVPDPRGEPRYDAAAAVDGPAPTPEFEPHSRQLTTAVADHGELEWAPDGRSVIVVAPLHEGSDDDLRRHAHSVPIDGGPPVALTEGDIAVAHAVLTADWTLWFAAQELGDGGRDFVGAPTNLYRRKDGISERLTDPATTDLTGTLHLDGVDALITTTSRGTVPLLRATATGAALTLVGGAVEVTGLDVAGGTIAVSITRPDSSGEIAIVDEAVPGGVRHLTDLGAGIRDTGLVEVRELEVAARDGSPVHGWVALPAGDGPHPVLLLIHGGPFSQYTATLFDEVQVYADAGYAVVFGNPRGSSGYGFEHGRSIRQAMGTVDHTDVLDFLEGAIAAHPTLDGDRLGILGGSYGGYLTAWIIAHDHRFRAAIVERGFLDPESFVGSSDIGSFFGQEYVGTDAALIRSQSPQAVAHQVTTPTLVVHSAEDLRCPLGQAERYYVTLKQHGVETELLVFPAENHELSRSGRPRHRAERFDAILDWWARHLPTARA